MMRWTACVAAVGLVWAGAAMGQGVLSPGSSELHMDTDMSSSGAVAALTHPVSGQPYEASKVTHSVWKLADGTTIRHDAESKIARDDAGRVREDIEQTRAMSLGGKQTNSTVESVTVADPVDHSLLTWSGTGKLKLATRMQMPDLSALTKKLPGGVHGIMGGIAIAPPPPPGGTEGPHVAMVRLGSREGNASAYDVDVAKTPGTDVTRDVVRTEELGQQSLAGLLVTGKRTTTMIPTGKIGNNQPITIVHEEWYSPDLQVVVKTMDSDPRSGERTMELQGLTRGEPDAALFHVPEGYEVRDMAGMMKALGGVGKPAETK
ncbi:MAG: hypothetical protein V4555_08615 [Acidobacteriota bacterium]